MRAYASVRSSSGKIRILAVTGTLRPATTPRTYVEASHEHDTEEAAKVVESPKCKCSTHSDGVASLSSKRRLCEGSGSDVCTLRLTDVSMRYGRHTLFFTLQVHGTLLYGQVASQRRHQASAVPHQAFDPVQVVHQECAVAAAPRDALRAAEVDVHVVSVRLHVARRGDDRVRVVAAELREERPAIQDAICCRAISAKVR